MAFRDGVAYPPASNSQPRVQSQPRALPGGDAEFNAISSKILRAAVTVHKRLGPGLFESVYEACMEHELRKAGVQVRRQVPVQVTYDGLEFDEAYRLDLLVEDQGVVELKTTETVQPVHKAQLPTYLKLANKRLGLLITFNVTLLKDGVTRLMT
jgi:GxxExxY protein